ncbi:hypothetical protein ACHQM5_028377 [Ranunculus cassubicifolius]
MNSCLPEVILFEILVRIPAEDLIRFKTVCKTWYYLISSQKFVTSHLALAAVLDEHEIFPTTYPWVLTEKQGHIQMELPLAAVKQHLDYNVWEGNSCNGLILVIYPLAVCNPVTHQFEYLSSPPPPELDSVFLVHDNFADKFKVFAFYSIHHEFHVLTLSKLCWKVHRKRKWRCSVSKRERKHPYSYHTFAEDDWTEMEKPPLNRNEGWFNYRSNFLVLENEVHWVGAIRSASYGSSVCEDEPYHLFSMNVVNEECRRNIILIRQDIVGKCCRLYLSELKGLPCLAIILHEYLEIHIFEDNENCQWITLPRISLVPISNGHIYERFSWIQTFVVCKLTSGSGDIRNLVKVFIVHEDQVFLYELKSQDFKQIGFFNKDLASKFPYIFHVNSLVWWK